MAEKTVVEDCFGILKLYSDGSISRDPQIKHRYGYLPDDGSVIWKDRLFEADHNLHLRLYKPQNSNSSPKLPIVIYFHPGGFCFGSVTYPNSHNSCRLICSTVGAVVISADYRLAPENRLPAALDDGRRALKWLRNQAVAESADRDKWLGDEADFDRVFVFGDSSGGNMAHHLAVEVGRGSLELSPVKIRGYILLSPFFGGTEKTKKEEEMPNEEFWSQEIYERFWRLTVPIGADTDHPLVNPFGPGSPNLKEVNLGPILVIVGAEEILKDRGEMYGTKLKALNKNIKKFEAFEEQHGFFTSKPQSQATKDLLLVVKQFIYENSQCL